MHFRGLKVVIIVVYLIASLGMAGENVRRLSALAPFAQTLAFPWALIGDFNIDAHTMEGSGWAQKVGAAVRVLVMTGRILEQITYMLRPGQVERTQPIDWLHARGRGVVASMMRPRDPDEASDGNDRGETSSQHDVTNQ